MENNNNNNNNSNNNQPPTTIVITTEQRMNSFLDGLVNGYKLRAECLQFKVLQDLLKKIASTARDDPDACFVLMKRLEKLIKEDRFAFYHTPGPAVEYPSHKKCYCETYETYLKSLFNEAAHLPHALMIVKMFPVSDEERLGLAFKNNGNKSDFYLLNRSFFGKCLTNTLMSFEEMKELADLFIATCSKIDPHNKSKWHDMFAFVSNSRFLCNSDLLRYILSKGITIDQGITKNLITWMRQECKGTTFAKECSAILKSTIKTENDIQKKKK
jgi:hypothetical protein